MKIMDILNNIANNKKVPKKIKYNNKIYNYCGLCKIYERSEGTVKKTLYDDIYDLNDEVEIIEDKDIEEIEIIEYIGNYFIIKDSKKSQLSKHDTVIIDKINELVREVNKIKKGLK